MKGKFVRAMAVALCCAMLAGCGKKEEGGSLEYQGIAVTFDQSKIVPETAKQVAGVYYAVEKKDAALYKSCCATNTWRIRSSTGSRPDIPMTCC